MKILGDVLPEILFLKIKIVYDGIPLLQKKVFHTVLEIRTFDELRIKSPERIKERISLWRKMQEFYGEN